MKRILVVDDDPIIHKMVERSLQEYDIRVTSIYTGVEAITQFKYKHFDFAFIDVYLGSLMGTEVVNALTGIRNGTKIYLISAAPENAEELTKKSNIDISGIIGKVELIDTMKSLLATELKTKE